MYQHFHGVEQVRNISCRKNIVLLNSWCQELLYRHTHTHTHIYMCNIYVEVWVMLMIENWRWLPLSLISQSIIDFFFSTIACELAKLARNDPLGVLKKCGFISYWFKIQHGRLCLWLEKALLTSFSKQLHMKSPSLTEMFIYRFWKSIVTFYGVI